MPAHPHARSLASRLRLGLSQIGIRHQLLGLFGLFLLTGVLVLALDQIAQYHALRSMTAMKDDVLTGMTHIRKLSDAYSGDVLNTTFRTRNYLIDWDEAVQRVEQSQATIAKEWEALQAMQLEGDDRALLEQALLARPRADEAVDHLHEILRKRDILALGRFADRELYPALDPLVERLRRIDQRGYLRAEALVRTQLTRSIWVSRVRIGLSVLCFVVAVVVGRMVLRNGYRGVESLSRLARRMLQNDYDAQPDYLPSGELGEVMDSFLQMRRHVRRIEAKLTDQLLNNERVRGALERREQFQRLLLEAAQTAIFAVDEDGVFSQMNPFAERLLGWPAGSLLGREKLDAILDPDAVQALARALSDAYAAEIPANWKVLQALAQHREPPREFTLRHKRGRTLPVLLALSAMRDEDGQVLGLLAVATDLTVMKRLERALRDSEARARDANRAKSAFLAAMSHEIRTPMIGVTGMIEVLSHTRLDDEQRRSLSVVQSSAEALLRIIGDILDFSKIEAGKMEIEPVPTSLPTLARSVTANYSGSASAKGLVLTCEVDPEIAPAHYADPVRLRQVVGNFLSNAIKFTERGSIVVTVEQLRHDPADGAMGKDVLLLQVTDTGIGISEQAQARLFKPFAQAEADTTRRYGGTGLGLAISRRIAELMGGTIDMTSTPGKGTSMRLEVALHRAPPEELPEMGMPGQAAGGFAPRKAPTVAAAEAERSLILLVDDHPTNRQVIQRQLALAGYASETAEDGLAGLACWQSGRYALVLTDVHMPGMDGYQLARAIRNEESQRDLPRTPVVALTASALKGEAERCLAAGMDDYLAKPVGIAAMGTCLLRWLPHTAPTAQPAQVTAASTTAAEDAPAEMPDREILRRSILDELTGGHVDDIRALLEDYWASTQADLAELEQLQARQDLQGVIRQAHKLKGAARLVGALELAAAAAALEGAGRNGEVQAIPELLAEVGAACERLQVEIRRHFPA